MKFRVMVRYKGEKRFHNVGLTDSTNTKAADKVANEFAASPGTANVKMVCIDGSLTETLVYK